MLRLFVILLALPFWAYFPIAAGLGYLAEHTYQSQLEEQNERVQALSHGPPALVDLSDFRRETDIGPVNEVNIEGWVNPDYNYNLTKSTDGAKTDERWMYLMFGRGDTNDSKVVRAALVFTASEKAKFFESGGSYISGVDTVTDQIILKFNGFGSKSDSFSELVKGAIEEKNLTTAPDFIYISPFFGGRDAALAPNGDPEKTRMNIWLFAAAVAFFGLVKLGFGRRKKAKQARSIAAAQTAAISADTIAAPQMAQFTAAPAQKVVQKAVRKTKKKFPVKMALLVGLVVTGAFRPALLGTLLPFVMALGFFALQFFGLRKIKQFLGGITGKAASSTTPKQTFSNPDLPASAPQSPQSAQSPPAMAQASKSAAFDRRATLKPKSAVPLPTSRFAARDSFADGPIKSGSSGLFGRFAKKKSVDPFEKLAQARKSF